MLSPALQHFGGKSHKTLKNFVSRLPAVQVERFDHELQELGETQMSGHVLGKETALSGAAKKGSTASKSSFPGSDISGNISAVPARSYFSYEEK